MSTSACFVYVSFRSSCFLIFETMYLVWMEAGDISLFPHEFSIHLQKKNQKKEGGRAGGGVGGWAGSVVGWVGWKSAYVRLRDTIASCHAPLASSHCEHQTKTCLESYSSQFQLFLLPFRRCTCIHCKGQVFCIEHC